MVPRLRELFRQAAAEVASNRRNKIHPTWELLFSPPLHSTTPASTWTTTTRRARRPPSRTSKLRTGSTSSGGGSRAPLGAQKRVSDLDMHGWAKKWSTGLVTFVPVVAYHFYLNLTEKFTQCGDHLLAKSCTSMRSYHARLLTIVGQSSYQNSGTL